MTPAQMIAAALASGSPVLQTLVLGHIAAGRIGMAELALMMPQEAILALEDRLTIARAQAAALGLLVALTPAP